MSVIIVVGIVSMQTRKSRKDYTCYILVRLDSRTENTGTVH